MARSSSTGIETVPAPSSTSIPSLASVIDTSGASLSEIVTMVELFAVDTGKVDIA